LPFCITSTRGFAAFYSSPATNAVTRWENGDVWGDDFRDDGGDIDPSGGSDLPDIYF
jgi:hypothetical protein